MTNRLFAALLGVMFSTLVCAEGEAPWGHAKAIEQTYAKHKVVYDVSADSVKKLENVLDRASYLSLLYEADPFDSKIVLVLHGDEIPVFAIRNFERHRELVKRAQSLTVGGVIEIRMCRAAAKRRGFVADDIHGFISMVPMADAEIVKLQSEGYAYMQ
jgi:intracellular sulfur oxidation DsrE/DsrF family protein